jgi:hypothetical protein
MYGLREEDLSQTGTTYLLQCSYCKGVSIWYGYGPFNELKPEEDSLDLLWPYEKFLESLPGDAASKYRCAEDIREKYPDMAAASLRKGLEILSREAGAAGDNLYQMIKNLQKRGYLPDRLYEAADAIRTTGNRSVHETSAKITEGEVKVLSSLFRLLAEFLFVLPKETAALRSLQDYLRPQAETNEIEQE